jgi:hypothetical protein
MHGTRVIRGLLDTFVPCRCKTLLGILVIAYLALGHLSVLPNRASPLLCLLHGVPRLHQQWQQRGKLLLS